MGRPGPGSFDHSMSDACLCEADEPQSQVTCRETSLSSRKSHELPFELALGGRRSPCPSHVGTSIVFCPPTLPL